MAGKLHHMAVNSANFEETVKFFEELFEMEVRKTSGEVPNRKLWFVQGIQVDDREATIQKALSMGCKQVEGKPSHWFLSPDGILIELME